MTLNIGLEQEIDRSVAGEDYSVFLNNKETTLKVIKEVMEPFLAELDSEL